MAGLDIRMSQIVYELLFLRNLFFFFSLREERRSVIDPIKSFNFMGGD